MLYHRTNFRIAVEKLMISMRLVKLITYIFLLTIPSPIFLMTQGRSAVDPVCDVTTVLFSVPKCFSGVLLYKSSRGGKETVSSLCSGFSVEDEGTGDDGPVDKKKKV